MQMMVVRDEVVYAYPRYDFQDPGQIGTMLDEIALLKQQIAELDGANVGPSSNASVAEPARAQAFVPAVKQAALDVAFRALLDELGERHRRNKDGRVELHDLQSALRMVLTSEPFLGAVFETLRDEMSRIQTRPNGEAPGPDALRDALRVSLLGIETELEPILQTVPPIIGNWPNAALPGMPADPHIDGWHRLQGGDDTQSVLFWNAASRTWSCSMELSAGEIVDGGMRYCGRMR